MDNAALDAVRGRARDAGIRVIGVNMDDTAGAAGNPRQAFAGQGFLAAGHSPGRAQSANLPAAGPIRVLIGIPAPWQNRSAQRGQGVLNFLEEFGAMSSGPPRAATSPGSGSTAAPTLRSPADRLGASPAANPDSTACFDTGVWHAAVARVLADRGVPPGQVRLGGLDLVPEVVEQRKRGCIQVQVDRQPSMQGFMPVMMACLNRTVGLAPTDIDTGQGIVTPEDAPAIRDRAAQGLRRDHRRRAPARARRPDRKGRAGAAAPQAFLGKPALAAALLLVLLVALFQWPSNGVFLSQTDLRGVRGLLPGMAPVAVGVTLLMICGAFDLPVGSVFALMPMSTAVLMTGGWPFLPALAAGLALGALIGFLHGWITIRFAIPSFIVTLGMLFMARSLTVVISGGFPPRLDPARIPAQRFVAFVGPGGMPRASLPRFLGIAVLPSLLLSRPSFGNRVRATGGFLPAAQAMGMPIARVRIACFMICSVPAGFAGMIRVLRLGSPLPSLGEGLDLPAVAAAAIGGTALSGGIGSILGGVIGATLSRVIGNGLVLSRIDSNRFNFAIGALTIRAVLGNAWLRKRGRAMTVVG